MTITPFSDYKKAHDEMGADVTIRRLQEYIGTQMKKLAELEVPYHERMAVAAEEIRELVMAEGKTIVLSGVRGSYYKGRRSTSWKGIATELDPPEELVEKHTKVGEPSVIVSIVDG